MQLSVIIVNYNVRAFLQQCLESVHRSLRDLDAEIIVVDNHSVDGSLEMLKEEFPHVHLVANDTNVGFARANNQALTMARGAFLWLLNPDTIIQEDSASVLLDEMENHPEVGMLGCKILNDDGSLQKACRRSFPTPWVAFTKLSGLARLFPDSRLFGRYNLTYLDPEDPAEVDAISGSNMFVRRTALETVGPLDDTFFMYGEDLDWCYRFQAAGWQIRYTPRTSIIHYKGESAKHSSWGTLANFYKAMDIFARKHFQTKSSWPLHWLLRLGIFFRYALSILQSLGTTLTTRVLDILGLGGITLAAIYVKFGTFAVLDAYRFVLPIYLLIWYVALVSMGLYRTFRYSISRAVLAVTLGFLVNVTLTFFFKEYAFSRLVMLMSYAGSLVWVPTWRILAARRRSENYAVATQRALIIGAEREARKVFSRLVTDVELGYDPVGIVVTQADETEGGDVVGHVDDLLDLVRVHEVDQVIFASDNFSISRIFGMLPILTAEGVKIKLVPGNLSFIIGKSSVDSLRDVQFVDVEYRFLRSGNRILKRSGDLCLGTLLWILCVPWTALRARLAGIPKMELDRPGIQGRIYAHGGAWSPVQERIPLLGKVLRGQMSLVGAPLDLETIPEGVPYGIVSLEMLRSSNQLTDDERLALLNYYLHNQSLLLDLEILTKTFLGK